MSAARSLTPTAAVVLAAVNSLGRATARNVAERTGLAFKAVQFQLESLAVGDWVACEARPVPGRGRVNVYSLRGAEPVAPASGVRVRMVVLDHEGYAPPRTWGECQAEGLGSEESPCPWFRCSMHLGINVEGERVEELDVPDDSEEPWEPKRPTCARRVAEGGATVSDEVGRLVGVTGSRVRQIENEAAAKLRATGEAAALHALLGRASGAKVAP